MESKRVAGSDAESVAPVAAAAAAATSSAISDGGASAGATSDSLDAAAPAASASEAASAASESRASASTAASTDAIAALPAACHGIHPSWASVVAREASKPYFRQLLAFVGEQRRTRTVFPPEQDVFAALALTGLDNIKVVIVGQDPYHGPGQAHGLAFSVRPGVKIPPSLRNMYTELASDVGCTKPNHGDLRKWAQQGVLLINTVLTVRSGEAHSHKNRGWERFTSAVLAAVGARPDVVFLLWGKPAQAAGGAAASGLGKLKLVCAHPSPLSASRGFFGCKHFSKANEWLRARGKTPIDWQID